MPTPPKPPKACNKCGVVSRDFPFRRNCYEQPCRPCRKVIAREQYHVTKKLLGKSLGWITKDRPDCGECGTKNAVFYVDAKGQRKHPCRACTAARSRLYYHAVKDDPTRKQAKRERALKRLYKLTLVERDEMVKQQGGACYICGIVPQATARRTKILNVDHDHKTGKVRALLCNRCNVAVGVIESDLYPKHLEYLAKFAEEGPTDAEQERARPS